MKPVGIYDIIRIDEFSATPKYQQIVYSLLKGIEHGRLKQQDILPSINDLSYELDVSRDTAEKGYRYLKKIGVIGSVPGKGYFIKSTEFEQAYNICLLFNKLSAHKKIIYDSFVECLGGHAAIDFYIYNNDLSLFRKLLSNKNEEYSHYVIIPHFIEGGENAASVINEITKGNLILLDKIIPGIKNEYGAVYENFETDIYNALKEALPQLQKYQTLKIIFPSYSYSPDEILKGFQSFCRDYAFSYNVVHNIADEEIAAGEAYINLMEDDLVTLLEKIKKTKLKVGKDVGIISYNETPWKQFILDGITTISTDFKKMGAMTAGMILNHKRDHLPVPFKLTLRKSL